MSQRDEYVEKMKTQFDQWSADIAKWEVKAQGAQAGLRHSPPGTGARSSTIRAALGAW